MKLDVFEQIIMYLKLFINTGPQQLRLRLGRHKNLVVLRDHAGKVVEQTVCGL